MARITARPRRCAASAAAIPMLALLLGRPAMAVEPMLDLVGPAQVQALRARFPGKPALVFTEHRGLPIRRVHGIPASWLPQLDAPHPRFAGEARPGEFYLFQVGVYALRETGPLTLQSSPLVGAGGALPAKAMRCLSLGGIDYRGNRFAKSITVPAGDLQALWIAIDVPATALGEYRGTARLRVAPRTLVPIDIQLTVSGEPVTDHGDSQARNLSRLRWLDSTVGSEPTITHPFTPVRVRGRTIRVLGRDLVVGEDGLPSAITSYFSAANTAIQPQGRPVLASPMSFEVECGGRPITWRPRFGSLKRTATHATWTASAQGDGIRTATTGRLDYTGSGEVAITLTAERDIELDDARLVTSFREEAARYLMGLNRQGMRRPARLDWRWDTGKRQDCVWMGDLNAGLMLRFKDEKYLRPPVNIYYAFRPLRLPASWGNGGKGGVEVAGASAGAVPVRAFSGPRRLARGRSLHFVFELYLTPFMPLDTEKQWSVRFAHVGGPGREHVDSAVAATDPTHGPDMVNVHHASFYSPYINYPYSDDSFAAFRELVQRAHSRGAGLRVYYTTREITQNMPELFPLHSFNGEIILPGPGKGAHTLLHPNGPHPWLVENLRESFIPAWEAQVGKPYADLDLSVITTPDSRWSNFYLEGLRWLVEKSNFDGVYIDDTALDASSLQRARRILDGRPGRIIDLHTWNHFNEWAGWSNNLSIYMEILPYLDRLWLGEGFNANEADPDFWLVEMSGLPFGVMSEMLDGANPWRGMVFGETARHLYSGDNRALWAAWDRYGIQGTEFLPWCAAGCPVQTGSKEVLATVYRRKGRSFIALGSWARAPVTIDLTIDWKALGLDPARARILAPAIAGMQDEKIWRPGQSIEVAPGRGWFLVVDEDRAP